MYEKSTLQSSIPLHQNLLYPHLPGNFLGIFHSEMKSIIGGLKNLVLSGLRSLTFSGFWVADVGASVHISSAHVVRRDGSGGGVIGSDETSSESTIVSGLLVGGGGGIDAIIVVSKDAEEIHCSIYMLRLLLLLLMLILLRQVFGKSVSLDVAAVVDIIRIVVVVSLLLWGLRGRIW